MQKIPMISLTFFLLCTLIINIDSNLNTFYPSNLSETLCAGQQGWTTWFNTFSPNNKNTGDEENTALIVAQNPQTMCSNPSGIQAQSINYRIGNLVYGWQWRETNGIVAFLSFFSTEPKNVDFRVRYCCAKNTFVSPMTSSTPPMSLDNPTCGKQEIIPRPALSSRIFGGTIAIPHSWPWMVHYIQEKACPTDRCYTGCAAILISRDYVITAAHCVTIENFRDIILIAGLHNRSSTEENSTRQIRSVERVSIHPEYNSKLLENDIAVLRVNSSFQLNRYVQAVCLPGAEPQANEQVIIVGWGAETFDGTMVDSLKQAMTTIVSNCDSFWPEVDLSRQICVANRRTGDSACQGDSGGPILSLDKGQYVVSGIGSYVKDCQTIGNTSKPNVYTRVAAYKTWIKHLIG